MLDTVSFVYKEADPKKKTKQWIQNVITVFRTYWVPLVGAERAALNRAIMYGQNSIKNVEDSFEDEAFKKATVFAPLPLLEAPLNAIVEEITQNPPRTEVKAQDPLSYEEKDNDIKLLKNRKIIETDVSRTQQSVGLPPYKVPYDEFSSNVQEFDDLQLNENDPEDMDVYKSHFQKLWYEMGAQAAVDAIMKTNKYDEDTMRTMVKDAFAYKAVASQAYVDQLTGEIKYKYVDPTLLWGIFGKTNSGTGDTCRGYYEGVTLDKWLSLVGNEFDFKRDWKDILWGINYCMARSYTGFERGGLRYSCLGSTEDRKKAGIASDVMTDNLIQWDQAYMFKVFMGYIEFPCWEATSSFKYAPDGEIFPVDYDDELTEKENTAGYQKESKYQQVWYRSYFLATSSITQCIYGFQKIYFQNLQGLYDEYSNGTLCYYQEQGQSAVELSANFLNIANFAFYRFMWLVWHTKPLSEEYLYDELITLAKAYQREMPQQAGVPPMGLDTILENIIQQQRKGMYRIRTYPVVEGKKVPQIPQDGRQQGDGGVDPTAMVMQAIVEWAKGQILNIIGFNAMRTGGNPPSRESLKTEQNTVAASQNATGYMYRMIQYPQIHMATTTLNYISDIMQFEGTMPYKWLEKLVGSKMFSYLKKLDKEVGHRLGIFVHDINLVALKQRTMQAADIALSQKMITVVEWNILANTSDPKLANARLAIFQRQREKRARREAMEIEQIKQQGALQLEQAKAQTASVSANAQISAAQISAQAQVESARIQSQGRIDVKQMQVDAEPVKQESKAAADIMLAETENNLKQQQPLTGASLE